MLGADGCVWSMTLKAVEQATSGAAASRVRGYLRQALMVVLSKCIRCGLTLTSSPFSVTGGSSGVLMYTFFVSTPISYYL